MKSLLNITWKIFTRQYYIINAGFFLLVFILMFGIVHPAEIILVHKSLIHGIIESNLFTFAVLVIWMVYSIKCILFCLKIIKREEDTVLFNLQSIRPAKQYLLLTICHFSLYLPVLLYSCFIIYYALMAGFILYACCIVLFQLMMCIAGAVIYFNAINYSWRKGPGYIRIFPRVKWIGSNSGLVGYLLSYTFHKRKVVFIVTKLTGLFLLNVIIAWGKADFELRNFILVFMLVVLIHAMLVYFYVDFFEKKMSFVRNLPLSTGRIIISFILTYSFILLPELIFMVVNAKDSIPFKTIMGLYGIAVAELLLFTALLYVSNMRMKTFLQMIFAIYLTSSILMLSGNYVMILIAMGSMAMIIFYKNFYNYEAEL